MQHQSITDYQGHYYFNPEYIYEEGNPRPVLIYKNVVYFTVDSKGVHHYHQTFCGQFQDPEQFAVSSVNLIFVSAHVLPFSEAGRYGGRAYQMLRSER